MVTELAPDDLAGRIIRIISSKQRIPADTIHLDSSFDELKIDSLDGINIVFAVEEEFDISVPDEGVRDLKTVKQMVDGVRKLIEEKQTGIAPGLV